jgi:hypothetical protein
MRLKRKKAFNLLFSVFIAILALPTSAILASWNSLPGSTLYPVKRNLEKLALALLPDSFFEMQLRFKLLDRRLNEANVALIQQAAGDEALNQIVAEAKSAQLALANLTPEARQQAIPELINKLDQTNQTLEQVKITIAQAQTSSPTESTPTSSPTTAESPDQTQPSSPSPSPSPLPADNDISEPIDDTQEEIEEIIKELESQAESLPNEIETEPADNETESQPESQPQPGPQFQPGQQSQSNNQSTMQNQGQKDERQNKNKDKDKDNEQEQDQ